MNINDYRKAMNRVIPDHELKERIMQQKTYRKQDIPIRRFLVCSLAAVMVMTCLTSVALAASPELRAAVLSFFRMDEREQVPGRDEGSGQSDNSRAEDGFSGQPDNSRAEDGSSGQPDNGPVEDGFSGQPDISQAEIGSLVKAQYIRMDQFYGFSGGLLNSLTWSDDGRTLLKADFWEVKDNGLIPVQVDMQTDKIDITYQGIRYQGELYWFIRNGELYFFQGSPYGVDTRPEDQWYAEAIPGHTDVLLLRLARGRQTDYTEYPMLYRLDTEETEDLLSGTGVDKLECAYSYSWSEDMRRVLILCGPGPDEQQGWLCSLDTKSLSMLEELTGLDEGVSAGFAGNDTLILTAHTTSEEDDTWQTVACYAYDISTGQTVKTLDEAHYYRWWEEEPYGVMLFGSRCILIGRDGQVRLVDLKTGTQTVVEGFTYRQEDKFMPSPFGDKLLYYSSDPEAEGLGIAQLGVVDLEKGTFIAFDREGYNNLYEEGIGWSDNNTVSIHARTLDGGSRYLILYQF